MHKCIKNVANVAQEATLNQLNNESPVMKYWTSVSFEWIGHKSGQRCILLLGTPANLLGGDLETPSKSMADYELWQKCEGSTCICPEGIHSLLNDKQTVPELSQQVFWGPAEEPKLMV